MSKIFKPYIRKTVLMLFSLIYILLYPVPKQLYEMEFCRGAQVLFYTAEIPAGLEGCTFTDTGQYYEISVCRQNAAKVFQTLEFAYYQSVIFYGEKNYVLKQLGIKNCRVIEIAGGTLYTGYSAVLKGRKIDKGSINVQVFCKEGKIIIGSPSIYGSF